jgi:hypothetical protein
MPNGMNNAAPGSTMVNSAQPDPSGNHTFFDEFDSFATANWTITNVGVTPTNALTSEDGGALLTTTTTGAADASYLQRTVATFKIQAARQAMFKARLKPSDSLNSDIYAGMIALSATPLAAAEALYFFKAAGQRNWVLRSVLTGSVTDLALPAACVAADNTYTEVGFAFDGRDLYAYFNSQIGTQTFNPATMNRDYVAVARNVNLSTALMSPSFGIRNGAAAAKTLTTDYLLVSYER